MSFIWIIIQQKIIITYDEKLKMCKLKTFHRKRVTGDIDEFALDGDSVFIRFRGICGVLNNRNLG